MVRYAAFLRGVMPFNCKMPELRKSLEAAGFTDVGTLLSSGNAVFTAPSASEATIQRKAEAGMQKVMGRSFSTFVRTIDDLRAMLASDPWRSFRLKPGSKRVVTFLHEKPAKKLKLPIELEGARILTMTEREIFTAYVRNPKGNPVFMSLIEQHCGKDNTTRTWDTVSKVAR